MKLLKLDRQSIVFRLIVLIISMIIGQAVLLSLFLIVGGCAQSGRTKCL